MTQRNQLNVKLKINVSVTRAMGDQIHVEVVDLNCLWKNEAHVKRWRRRERGKGCEKQKKMGFDTV